VCAVLVKLALGFPLLTLSTSLFFDTMKNPMALLIDPVSFHRLTYFLVMGLAGTFSQALCTRMIQSVFGTAVFVEVTLSLPFLASAASLLLGTINNPMSLLV